MTHRTGAAMSCRDRAHPKAACTLSDGDDLIAIDPVDRPKLLVLLEVFFGVGERDGLPEAAACHLQRYRLVLGDTCAAATAPPTTAPACATAA
jgi:hypothetical protein